MQGDRFVQRSVGDDVEDRCESFFLNDLEFISRRSDARRDVATAGVLRAVELLTAVKDFAAFFLDLADGGHHCIDGLGVDERTHERAGFERVADFHLLVGREEWFDDGGADGFVDDDAACGRAALAGRSDGAK